MYLRLNKIFFCVGVGFCFSLLFLFPNFANAVTVNVDNILTEINKQRATYELRLLDINDTLVHVANIRGVDMLENNYFSHQSPEGLMPWDIASQENYDYQILGENLALDYFDTETLINDWMDSSEHRNNILNPHYSETGIKVMQKDAKILIVQLFAQPKINSIVPTAIYDSINDQTVVSSIPNKDDTENFAVLGTYNVRNSDFELINLINMQNLWIFLLSLGFFAISIFLHLIPVNKSPNL